MLLLIPMLAAHPGSSDASGAGRDAVGHRIELVVGRDTVQLEYTAEVPERRVREEARAASAPGFGSDLLASLADGVRLLWEGDVLPATRVDLPGAVAAGEPGFLDFTIAWRATPPSLDGAPPSGTLGVRNGNFPESEGFFATSVTLDGHVLAQETSLLKVKQGRIRDNWHGAWVQTQSAREPWVTLRPAGALERAAGPLPLPERMAGVAGTGPPPPWVLAVLALALVPIAWLGRTLGRRARR